MRLRLFLLLWLSPVLALAQFTTVTATVTTLQSATYTFDFVNQASGGPPLLGGISVFPTTVTGAFDASGHLSVSLADNNQVIPIPSQWRLSVTLCKGSASGPIGFNIQQTITGTTVDLSSALTAALPSIPTGCNGGGGGSGSVQPAPQFRLFIQPNSGTQAVAGPASTSQNAVTPILQGTANTDIFGNVSSTLSSPFCTASGCFFARPFTSTDTGNIAPLLTTGSYLHGQDNEYGMDADFFYNVGQASVGGNDFRSAKPLLCFWDSDQTQFLGGRYCNNWLMVQAGGGQYVRGQPTGTLFNTGVFESYTRAISELRGTQDYMFHAGDAALFYDYMHIRGGFNFASDEGHLGRGLHITWEPNASGTITTGGANATTIKANFTANSQNVTDGDYLLDTKTITQSGYIGALTTQAGNLPELFQTVDINGTAVTHAVSTGIATLNGACGTATVRNHPASAVCPITIVSGAFTANAGDTVCVADWDFVALPNNGEPEQATITAASGTSLTLNLAYAHASGTEIFQGGGCGQKLVVGNGLANPASVSDFTAYFIAGAPDSTHYAYVAPFLSGQQGAAPIALNPVLTAPIVGGGLQRNAAGTTVTLSFPSSGNVSQLNGFTAPNTATVQVKGASPADFNGTITGFSFNAQTNVLTWNQTGTANESGTNGTISLVGANNYAMYCGAETVAIPTGSFSLSQGNSGVFATQNGTLQVEPNNCSWTVGDTIAQADASQIHATASHAYMVGSNLPGVSTNTAHLDEIGGALMSGAYVFASNDQDVAADFIGYGGTFQPHTYINATGFYNPYFNLANAPLNGGPVTTIGCPVGGCTSTNYDTKLYQVTTAGGTSSFGYRMPDGRFFNTSAFENDGYIAGTQAVGVGEYGGQFQAPGTAAYFAFYFSPNLHAGAATLGNGAYGDASGTLGDAETNSVTQVAGVPAPASISIYPQTTGTTNYTYICTATTPLGESNGISASSATGAVTPNNIINCAPPAGATGIKYYRTVGGATQGLVGTQTMAQYYATRNFTDNNLTATAGTAPAVNTTGIAHVYGPLDANSMTIGGNNVLTTTGTVTNGYLPMFSTGGATNSHCDDGATSAGVITCTEPIKVSVTYPNSLSLAAGTGSIPALAANSAGFAAPATGGTSYLIKLMPTVTAGIPHLAAPATADGVNESAMTSGPVALASADVSGVLPVANGGTGVQGAEVVTFSATPTFSTAFGASRIVLTGNVTSFTLGAGADGQAKQLCFEQDATGSRTVAAPANVHGFFTVGVTASKWSCQSFTYDNTDSIWLATSPGVTNE